MPRLFVAAWPPDEVLDSLEGLARPALDGVRWTTRAQWHVTLRFLGEVDEAAAAEALRAVEAESAQAVMGPATQVLGRRVLMAPVAGLDDVARAVRRATQGLGVIDEHERFVGHVTLARSKGPSLRRWAGQSVSGSWSAHELVLVRSTLAPTGAQYATVAVHRL